MKQTKDITVEATTDNSASANSSTDAKQKVKRGGPMVRRMSSEAEFMQASTRLKKRSTRTRIRLKSVYKTLCKFARKMQWHGFSPGTITLEQAKRYFSHRISINICPECLHSEASAIRNALAGVDRALEAKFVFTTNALGIPPRISKGKRVAVSLELYTSALEKADENTAALMMAMRNLGLRIEEATSCKDSVNGWTQLMGMGAPSVDLTFGAKNGRNRIIYIHAENRAIVHQTVAALQVITEGGKAHPMPSRSGETASRKLRDRMKKLGLTGMFSPHSLRSAFAVDQYVLYRKQGYNHLQSCSRVALDLGHGKGRGRWVWAYYVGPTLGEPPKSV